MKTKIESIMETKRNSMIFRKNWSTDPKKLDFDTDLGVWPSDDNTLFLRDADGFNYGRVALKDIPLLIRALQGWMNKKEDG